MRLMELGSAVYHQDQVRAAAMPYLQQLHWATGLTSQPAVLDEGKVVYLLQFGSRAGMPSRLLVGARPQALHTVAGKALLAHTRCSPDAVHVDVPNRLRAELAHIRERGVAFDREEFVQGIGSVAAPVIASEDSSALAAVSVSGPIDEMQFARLAPVVLQTAASVRRGAESAPPARL
ncbi:IclR family transcriptional regulator C-terminal domain-containing protein [Streptomyces sp. NPDC000410]|uniref:IclR family transcriptional regulator n=1 Tax=Streptomyces sp. NPDC000410 TaxID=3154254 RepID=UPI0033336DB9